MYCEVCGYESDEHGLVCPCCGSDVSGQDEESGDAAAGVQHTNEPDDGHMPSWSESGQYSQADFSDSTGNARRSGDAVSGQGELQAGVSGQKVGGLDTRGMIALAMLAIAILLALVALLCIVVFQQAASSSGSSSGSSASASADGESRSGSFSEGGTGEENGLKSDDDALSDGGAARTPFEANTTAAQQAQAVSFAGHHYLVVDQPLTWTEARDRCVEMEGHLATISDASEQKVVADAVARGNAYFYWIGLTSEGSKEQGRFEWIDGTELGYTNWEPGEPNNKAWTASGENYVGIWSRGTWNDFIDDGSRTDGTCGFVCEWDS